MTHTRPGSIHVGHIQNEAGDPVGITRGVAEVITGSVPLFLDRTAKNDSIAVDLRLELLLLLFVEPMHRMNQFSYDFICVIIFSIIYIKKYNIIIFLYGVLFIFYYC